MYYWRTPYAKARFIYGCWYGEHDIIHDHNLSFIDETGLEKDNESMKYPKTLTRNKLWEMHRMYQFMNKERKDE